MKRILPILIALLASNYLLNAQVLINKNAIGVYEKIKPETIFIQQNKSLLFSGEQFFYKVYCLNKDNTAGISKIAYIKLINSKKEIVIEQKIQLDSATGFGDFTIPFTIPSGNYKLIGYTQWMRNAGATNFFVNDLFIMNPFTENQEAIDLKALVNTSQKKPIDLTNTVQIQLEKNIFKPREKVNFQIKTSNNQEESFGNYTLSVKKINTIKSNSSKIHIGNYKELLFKSVKNSFQPKEKTYLVYPPEHKGELITGKVINIKNNTPIANTKVALSIPSKTFVIKIVKTNKFGEFYFDLDPNFEGQKAFIQVADNNKEKYKITLHKKALFDYSNLKFKKLNLSETTVNAIKKKSEYIQIENAYKEVIQDSIIKTEPKVTFYKPDYTYRLNDYKRFPTVHETIIEIIDHTWVKTKRKKHTFIVRDYKSTRKEDILPLILIDGVMVQNHEDLYNYDVNNIETINIITDKFLFENNIFGGVISVLTKETNFSPITKGSYLVEQNLTKILPRKKYFNQDFAVNLSQRIPDYRTQLLWKPDITFNSNLKNASFYTSDNKGVYEIKLEGFTYTGKAVSISKKITVQ